MAHSLKSLIVVVILLSIVISLVNCTDFKCPSHGTVNKKKVPDILKLIEKQNGFYSTVEVNNKDRENLVHEYFNADREIGFIDLEAMNQERMNRRYYYHETQEKIAIRMNTCTRLDLTQNEKVASIQDWFEPVDIVGKSEIFKDFTHFGPSVLMIYAHTISDKASFIDTEQIDGRSIDHWFYCLEDAGPYIDFYFDTVTSYPFRFSLFYPQMIQDGNETVQSEDNRHSDYVYNFFNFKPLVISVKEPIPYPIGYGCARKGSKDASLPDFTSNKKFTLDMEAIMTYSSGETIKSTARVMKVGEVYSYEMTEAEGTVRSIENPPPLGRWQVDQYTGKCKYYTSDYNYDTTLVTRWPFFIDRGFNLLYYIIMKPDTVHLPNFIGTIDLGSVRIEEYEARNFFNNRVDAIVDYHYPVDNDLTSHNIPSKIVFTKDRWNYENIPDSIEVTIIDYRSDYFDYEDRFDVSDCYADLGSYTWFQIVFSNPWLTKFVNGPLIQTEIRDFLVEFIPITRVSDIIVDSFGANIYVTVKLLDRIHFIEAYSANPNYKIENSDKTLKYRRVEDCEEACTSNTACTEFSYCSDFTCELIDQTFTSFNARDSNCTHYSRRSDIEPSLLLESNFLSSTRFVLHQIRRKMSNNELYLSSVASTAEELFVVHGPEEVGDISEELVDDGGGPRLFFRGDEYPVISSGRKLSSGFATELRVDYIECLRLCFNDDDCNTISHCPNQQNECILSSETNLTLTATFDVATSAADGCNIYEKSFLSYFDKYPGKSLVIDAVSIKEGIHFTDCAKECINSKDFNCESFDYCGTQHSQNDSVCFLHAYHITVDTSHEVNTSNWKFAENGCDHFSKKSDHDYRHIVAHELSTESEVIGTHEEIPLQDCANLCNSNPHGCYTFEYCETIQQVDPDAGLWWIKTETSWIKSSCRLSNVKPSSTSNTNDPEFRKYFIKSSSSDKICSVYINQEKIHKISQTHDQLNSSISPKDRTSLVYGLGTFFFVLAFAVGVVGFTFAMKRELISL